MIEVGGRARRSTVTIVPSWVVRVKVSLPTDLTVPTADGGLPPPGGRSACGADPDMLGGDCVVDEAAPATDPPARASPSAAAAAVVTRTPRLRRVGLQGGSSSP